MGGKKVNKNILKGIDYLHGTNELTYDPDAALEMFKQEAANGDLDAKFLADYTLFFEIVDGRKVDYKAIVSDLESYSDENPFAKIQLAYMYNQAYGVKMDKEKASDLYKEAISEIKDNNLLNSDVVYIHEARIIYSYVIYQNAFGDENYDDAAQVLSLSADSGNHFIPMLVANSYFSGRGVEADYDKALDLFKECFDDGSVMAANYIGYIYYMGDVDKGIAKNYNLALEWFTKSNEKDYPNSLYNTAFIYLNGRGVDRDIDKAISYFEKAYEGNYRDGAYRIGKLYFDGKAVEADYATALDWYTKAYDLGHSDSAFYIGRIYDLGGNGVEKNPEKSVEYYELAAKEGSNSAINNLGYKFLNGDGVEKDYKKGLEYYEEAANLGNTIAMRNLGFSYRYGIEGYMDPDMNTAISWYKKAAEADDADAMYYLGSIYFMEEGFKDEKKAVDWFESAGEGGNADGCIMVAYAYDQNIGVAKDQKKSEEWFKKAEQLNNRTDKTKEQYEFLTDSTKDMTGEQIRNAAIQFEKNGDYKSSFAYHYKAYKKGDDYSVFLIGWISCWGNQNWRDAGVKQDFEYGRKFLVYNAEKYNYSAKALGDLYSDKNYEGYNLETAKTWYLKAIELGYDKVKIEERLEKLGIK